MFVRISQRRLRLGVYGMVTVFRLRRYRGHCRLPAGVVYRRKVRELVPRRQRLSGKLPAEKTGLPMAAIKAEIHAAAAYAKTGEIYKLAEFMR